MRLAHAWLALQAVTSREVAKFVRQGGRLASAAQMLSQLTTQQYESYEQTEASHTGSSQPGSGYVCA